MSHGKQFTLYTHVSGPNGWKAAFVLEELGLTYESIYLDLSKGEQKASPHVDLNPNGRIPTLVDHQNGDFTIWESNAIMLYLVDRYDPEKKINITEGNDKYSLIQWLFFQSSGQGPYFGQVFWFTHYHPEKIPSAIERYQKETLRVISVLDGVLAKAPGGYLVGGKPTIADLSFVTWNQVAIQSAVKDVADVKKDYPTFYAWHQRLMERPAVEKLFELQASLRQ